MIKGCHLGPHCNQVVGKVVEELKIKIDMKPDRQVIETSLLKIPYRLGGAPEVVKGVIGGDAPC